MALFSLDVRSEDVIIKWLGSLPPLLNRYMQDGLERGGKLLVSTAQQLTQEADAIGSTREYYGGWKYQPESIRADGALGFFYNDSDHAYWAEHGRPAGGFPPETDEFLKWMDTKGIDRKASFVIRRAIAESGTVKRKGYKGFEIMERTVDMVRDDVLDEMEYGADRAIRAMQ